MYSPKVFDSMVYELYVLELIGYRFLAFGLKRRNILTVWNEIGKGKSHINYFWSENM